MKSKRCHQNTRHRHRPHEREKGRNVRGRRTLEERKVVGRYSNKWYQELGQGFLEFLRNRYSKGLVVCYRLFLKKEARAAGVDLKGFFEVRLFEVLAMKNTSKVLDSRFEDQGSSEVDLIKRFLVA
ncbi:hypothetical protein Tco_1480172 [Tanacetum coccineum]